MVSCPSGWTNLKTKQSYSQTLRVHRKLPQRRRTRARTWWATGLNGLIRMTRMIPLLNISNFQTSSSWNQNAIKFRIYIFCIPVNSTNQSSTFNIPIKMYCQSYTCYQPSYVFSAWNAKYSGFREILFEWGYFWRRAFIFNVKLSQPPLPVLMQSCFEIRIVTNTAPTPTSDDCRRRVLILDFLYPGPAHQVVTTLGPANLIWADETQYQSETVWVWNWPLTLAQEGS